MVEDVGFARPVADGLEKGEGLFVVGLCGGRLSKLVEGDGQGGEGDAFAAFVAGFAAQPEGLFDVALAEV